MIVINNIDNEKFSFNGVNYYKNFTPKVIKNKIEVLNTYDSNIRLTDYPTLFSDFTVDGNTFASVELLQDALLPVIYTRDSLGSGLSLEGYNETGTRAGGDLIVTIGDYDSSDNGAVLELDVPNETVSIKSDNQLNKVELSPNSLSFRFDNGYTAMSLKPLNTASTITRNLRLPDSSGTLATEDYVDNIFASLPSGTFTSTDGKTITVTNGLITNIV